VAEIRESDQLELLPDGMPKTRRARLQLSTLTGFEHAPPRRELVESIARLGLLQPVVAAESGESGYRVIEGRRRTKAIEQLAEDGRWPVPPTIDALVIDDGAGYGETVRSGMVPALHAVRSASPVSELQAIEAILEAGGEEAATVKRIAEQTGMPVQTVRRRLKLRALAPDVRAAFQSGPISVTVAEAAARLDTDQQEELERLAETGERITLRTVKDASRRRTREVAAELGAELFAERQTPWRGTVRGHLKAALDAIPIAERNGVLGQAIAAMVARAESGSDTQT
jgi:ParB-like chromosome segregation protein Spo0J